MQNLFTSARFKLTSWYITIIVIICLSFSTVIYAMIAAQIETEYKKYALRIKAIQFGIETPIGQKLGDITIEQFGNTDPNIAKEIEKEYQDQIKSAKNQVKNKLLVGNLVIIFLAGFSGYFLSGITLDPIQQVLDNQKRFVADASHELKTPITTLKSSLEVNLQNKKLDPNLKTILQSNLEEVNQLETLTKNLLDLNSFQNQNQLNLQSTDTQKIISKTIRHFQTLADQKQIQINAKLKTKTIQADSQKFEQLISIFIDNAIKYTDKKGTISISTKPDKKYLYIKIQDSGIGISKENQKRVFDRFFRADLSRCKTECKGFGLGLSIAQKIVHAHRGKIHLKSQLNKGSTFTIQLPIKQ